MAQDNVDSFDQIYAQEQIDRSQHPIRKIIKSFYINDVLRHVKGPTIDFGCGAGQLLKKLPAGSVGLEVNPSLISYLEGEELNVQKYHPSQDEFNLLQLESGKYKTFVISHVLEHFQDPVLILESLLPALNRLGVTRLIINVPCHKGYLSDATHQTYVDLDYVKKAKVFSDNKFSLTKAYYFPIDAASFGDFFIYNQLDLIYDTY